MELRTILIVGIFFMIFSIILAYVFSLMAVYLAHMNIWFTIAMSNILGLLGGVKLMAALTKEQLKELRK